MRERTKTIGLVLTSISEEQFKGYLAKAKASIEFDEFAHLTLRQEVSKTYFWCKPTTGQYKPETKNLEEALEIGSKLKEIGINDPKMIFNGEEQPIAKWLI